MVIILLGFLFNIILSSLIKKKITIPMESMGNFSSLIYLLIIVLFTPMFTKTSKETLRFFSLAPFAILFVFDKIIIKLLKK